MILPTFQTSARLLRGILAKRGIFTVEELKRIGSKDAFLRIRLHSDSTACLSKLSALEGAIQGIRLHDLTDEVKTELRRFYKSL